MQVRTLFAEDGLRADRLSVEAAGIFLDYSKHRVTDGTIRLLVALARECGLSERLEAMFQAGQNTVTRSAKPPYHSMYRGAPAAAIASITLKSRMRLRAATPMMTTLMPIPSALPSARNGSLVPKNPSTIVSR